MEKFIDFVNGKVQSLCDWKSSFFAWKGSALLGAWLRIIGVCD